MTIDFDHVILAHTAWKRKLTAYFHQRDGSLSAVETADPEACMLGRWFREAGAAYRGNVVGHRLESVHNAFHRQAADVIRQIDAGERNHDLLLGPSSTYAQVARAMIHALRDMRARIDQ